MSQAFESLRALTASGVQRIDVPVPACLNHCINQEVFYCKVCGEVFDNIHKYITHGKIHRSSSTTCAWCGGVWPSYSALCIHQLVCDSGEVNDKLAQKNEGDQHSCPLSCGPQQYSETGVQTHLLTYHGANQSQIIISNKDGGTKIEVEKGENFSTCPKCSTIIFEKVDPNIHLAFHCNKLSEAVKLRTAQFLASDVYSDNPLFPLKQEIFSLISHLKELMVNNEYRENFECEGEKADEKYALLPHAFTKQYLSWIPVGTSWHQVIESNDENFSVIFDVWCQVVDKLSSPEGLQDITQRLEVEVSDSVESGIMSRWTTLTFDAAMLDAPDQHILNSLEAQLGWVK